MTELDREILRQRRKLARELVLRTPYDLATVDRVLEIALEVDLKDPEEFLRRCSATGLDPISILNFARAGIRIETPPGPSIYSFRLRRSRGWLLGAWGILGLALFGLSGAISEGSRLDVGLGLVLVAGAILIIRVESRRLP